MTNTELIFWRRNQNNLPKPSLIFGHLVYESPLFEVLHSVHMRRLSLLSNVTCSKSKYNITMLKCEVRVPGKKRNYNVGEQQNHIDCISFVA